MNGYGCKNRVNNGNANSTECQKYPFPWWSCLYPRDSRMIQHSKINDCNIINKWTQWKSYDHINIHKSRPLKISIWLYDKYTKQLRLNIQ